MLNLSQATLRAEGLLDAVGGRPAQAELDDVGGQAQVREFGRRHY